MIDIKEKEDCCGCSACENICPKKCISMKFDKEGFLYPYVDKENCINCMKCEKVCPVLEKKTAGNWKKGYVLRNKDKDILQSSASGGFFTPFAEVVIKAEGSVCGASFDDDWSIIHKLTKDIADLELMRGSKYVQSDMRNNYIEIRKKLVDGETVLFCGTPCQVQGLKKFLDSELLKNLITVDIVCKGVASPGYWKRYLEYHTQEQKSGIESINFRKKVRGYHSSDMAIDFLNGYHYRRSKTDIFMKSYISEICSRPSCYQCRFKDIDRCSDFTIFDAWSAGLLVEGLEDDDKGYTTVIAHNDRAVQLLNSLKDKYMIYPIDINQAVDLDGIMMKEQAIPNDHRKKFLEKAVNGDIAEAVKHYMPITITDRAAEKIKDVLYLAGLLDITKRYIKNFKNMIRRRQWQD